jgi:3-isopropylmalate/(R)-2-methylmalate dehydratase small subunit
MSDNFVIPESQIIKIKGRCIPKPANDQNTDDIVPARYLKETTFTNMGGYVFFDERIKDGKPVANHPFNDSKYRGATILIASVNFGCGSSREHAPQALHRYGIKAIVAPSFAEIFADNCLSLGVVVVTVSLKDTSELADFIQQSPSVEIEIDLDDKVIRYAGKTVPLEVYLKAEDKHS